MVYSNENILDIAVDKFGTLYVADGKNEAIISVSHDGEELTEIYNSDKTPGLEGLSRIQVEDEYIYWT